MGTPPLEPDLDDLRHALDRAETEYICADFIDDNNRREKQLSYWRCRRNELKSQIARIEESI